MNKEERIFTISSQDYCAAQRLHLRPRPFFIFLLCLILIIALLVLTLSIQSVIKGESRISEDWILYIATAYLSLNYFVISPYRWRSVYRKHKLIQKEHSLAFTEEHLIGKTEESFSKLEWADFLKWKENKEMFLLYQTAGLFHIIPKRLFRSEEDVSDLRSVLTEKLGKQKS